LTTDACRMSRPDRTEAKAEFFKLLAEGQSVAAAARQVGVHNTVGYYWVKKRCTSAPPAAVRFAELKPISTVRHAPVSPSVQVVVGDAAIRVEAGFDAHLLRQVVSALLGDER
jgi:transposase-like protein